MNPNEESIEATSEYETDSTKPKEKTVSAVLMLTPEQVNVLFLFMIFIVNYFFFSFSF